MAKTLDPREMEALIAAEDVDIIDVRSASEFATGHVPNARLVPLDDFKRDPKQHVTKSTVIFVCAKGLRSATAATAAEVAGIKNAVSLDGGTLAWATAGLPLVIPEPPKKSDKAAAPSVVVENAAEAEPELDQIVGANLRDLRSQRGLSLDALSQAAGISRQTLGQVELGRTVPSIGTVWKIAQALGVPFSTLLKTQASSTPSANVLRRANGKRLMSSDGRFSSRALFPFGEQRKVEFYELWLAPHSKEEAEAHQPGTQENLIVVSGRLELKVGGTTHMLEKGDAILFTADVPHVYTNPDGEDCWMHLVMTYTDRQGS